MLKGFALRFLSTGLGMVAAVGVTKGLYDADTATAIAAAGVGVVSGAIDYFAARNAWLKSLVDFSPLRD